MIILPDTVYKLQYKDSVFLTRTGRVPRHSGYWSTDVCRISGSQPLLKMSWEFEKFATSGDITILECYNKSTYPEMYI